MPFNIPELIYSPKAGRDVVQHISIDYDPSKYQTKEAAARGLYEALCKLARERGEPESEVALFDPERCKQYSGDACWCVVWESGPYQWAIGASMNCRGPWGFTEPYYSFDLHFTD